MKVLDAEEVYQELKKVRKLNNKDLTGIPIAVWVSEEFTSPLHEENTPISFVDIITTGIVDTEGERVHSITLNIC